MHIVSSSSEEDQMFNQNCRHFGLFCLKQRVQSGESNGHSPIPLSFVDEINQLFKRWITLSTG